MDVKLSEQVANLENVRENFRKIRKAFFTIPGGGVTSVFGRTGAVTAQSNDYTWAQIDKTISSLADITTRSASDLNTGTLSNSRLTVDVTLMGNSFNGPSELVLLDSGSRLPAVDGSLLTGIIPSQAGNAGKFITTNGSVLSWAAAGGGGGDYVAQDGSTPLTGDWPVGTKSIIFDNGNTAAVPTNGLLMKGNNPILFTNPTGTNITRIYRDYYSGVLAFQRSTDSGATWGGSSTSFTLNCGSAGSPPNISMAYSGYTYVLSYNSLTTNGPLAITAGQANGTTSLVLNGTSSGPQGAGLAITNKLQGQIVNASNNSVGNRIHTGINCEVNAPGDKTTYEAFRLNVTETAASSILNHYLLRLGKGGVSFNSLLDVFSSGNVNIGGGSFSSSSILKIDSTTKGFLQPRMTTANWGMISPKEEGLQAWNNEDHAQLWFDGTRTIGFRYSGTKFQGYDGTSWIDLN